ncbi:Hypothetical protein CINCED_3A002209 [Cinara cedri]|uniref:RNA helicase n=1 Tax=Cinara cedri TaxID=506608 RepID=A0A5E4MF02_9HEMI|nr:Hypothetical protein CINCED_3A002209 [Cinara cedri]
MSAKLLSVNSTLNINDEQNWSKVKDKSNLIEFKLKSFYADYNSRIIHKEPSIGDIVAVLSETKTGNIMNSVYLRGIILNLNDTQTMDPKVTVKLIDQGRVEIVSKSKLFVLPDMLKSIETDTVDIILASVKPIDNDKSWCNYANFAVKKQFKYFEECGDTVIVKVKMTLESTIWAKSIYRKYWDTKLKSYTIVEILPALLLNTGYANLNFDHIETIKELSISAGINTPAPISLLQNHDQEKTKNYKFGLKEYMSFYKLPQPQWAYFDEDCTCVSVEHICDPKTFFVRNIKYLDLFCEIQKKIENYVEQKLVQTLQLTHIVEEAICLAKYRSTDKYYRVKIIGTSNTLVDVIYVDLGEMYEIQPNSLLTIHPDLVVQLPFQAIECSLSGFKNEKLTENILNELINFFFDLTDNYMSLKVVNNVGLAELTGGNHYEVVLYNKDFVVNLELQSKFSQHCDDIQMSKLSDIVNYTPDTLNAGTILNPDNILDEDLTGESCSVHMQLFEELGLLKWFNLKWEENTLLAIDENIQENDLKEEKEKEEEEEESIKTKIETKNENANSYKFVETVEKIKPVDLALPEKPSNSKITKLKPRKTNKVICLTCNTNLQSITPICIWYQVENNIYLKFNILKIDNFRINYTDNCLLFNAKFDDLTYNFTAKLFGLIIENSITHKITYEGFHIKAEKQYQMSMYIINYSTLGWLGKLNVLI